MNELELLEESIIKLKKLKQILKDYSDREKSKVYKTDFIKKINESIDYITLTLNKIKKKFKEEYEIKLSLIENELEKYKQKLEEKIKRKSKNLKKTEQNYRFITENINDVVSVFDKHFNLIYINEAQQKISGFSKEEIMGKKPTEFIHPEDIPRSFKLFQKAIEAGGGFGEFRLRCKDGSYVWLEVNAKIVNDKNGETNAVLVSRDITVRKLMEEKLKESEEKYKILTEHANDLICIIDEKFKFEYINENVHERLLGYINTDIIGKHVGLFIHPDDLKYSIESFRDAVQNGESKGEIRFRNKEGCYVWLEFKGELFIDRDGKRKTFLISRDITERKIAMQQLKESEKNLEFFMKKHT